MRAYNGVFRELDDFCVELRILGDSTEQLSTGP